MSSAKTDGAFRRGADSLVVPAPAKVNLHLGIHPGRDERGYHRADSVMVALALADEVTVEATPGSDLAVTMEPALDMEGERTLVARVARRMAELAGVAPEVRIRVVRRIPDKSGLGSSSTDAAAAIKALCELWGLDIADPQVVQLARAAGADVAFFLDPLPSWLDGVGDRLREAFPPLGDVPVVLVRPAGGVSTVEAYAEFDRDPEDPQDPDALCALLRTGAVDAPALAGLLANNLSAAAERLQPEVRDVRLWLEAQPQALGTLMCGSGSCVFALCPSAGDAAGLAGAAAGQGWWAHATHTSPPGEGGT